MSSTVITTVECLRVYCAEPPTGLPPAMSPLGDLNYKDGAPVFFEKIVGVEGETYSQSGWFVWDEGFGDFIALDALGTGQVNENLSGWQPLDEQRTLARRLLPGERLVVTFACDY